LIGAGKGLRGKKKSPLNPTWEREYRLSWVVHFLGQKKMFASTSSSKMGGRRRPVYREKQHSQSDCFRGKRSENLIEIYLSEKRFSPAAEGGKVIGESQTRPEEKEAAGGKKQGGGAAARAMVGFRNVSGGTFFGPMPQGTVSRK